jgi:hypothetical protein
VVAISHGSETGADIAQSSGTRTQDAGELGITHQKSVLTAPPSWQLTSPSSRALERAVRLRAEPADLIDSRLV